MTPLGVVRGVERCRWWVGVFVCALVIQVPAEASAGGFVGDAGELWVKLGYRSWYADREFAGPFDRDTNAGVELGDPIPFDSIEGGELELDALEVQAEYVPVERLVVGFYMPAYQRIRFENRNFRSVTQGTGDLRPYAGYQVAGGEEAATTLFVRPKIPTTAIDTDFLSVPLSEGQFDLAVEQVTSWRPRDRVQLTFSTLFRYRFPGRFPDSGETYKPGNEMIVRGTIGGEPVRTLWLKGGYRGLWSTGWEVREGAGATRSRFRAYQEVTGGLYWRWGEWIGGSFEGFAADASIARPFTGRDYPRGWTVALGLAWSGAVAGSGGR